MILLHTLMLDLSYLFGPEKLILHLFTTLSGQLVHSYALNYYMPHFGCQSKFNQHNQLTQSTLHMYSVLLLISVDMCSSIIP